PRHSLAELCQPGSDDPAALDGCAFSAIAVSRETAPTEVWAAWQGTSGSGKDRFAQIEPRQTLLYAFRLSTILDVSPETADVFGWVLSHESPGATLHSIHGLDVCASRRRATAAMRRRFHGATGGATIRGAICGTCALIASERARGPLRWNERVQ